MISHLYFGLSIYFLIWWIALFLLGKKCRTEILVMGFIGLVFAPFVQAMHLIDWWRPMFLFETVIKIEDLLFGFCIGGISTALYHIFISDAERKYKRLIPSRRYEAIMWVISLFLLFGLFYIFNIHSFWTSLFALIGVFVLVIAKRHDLLIPMILSGVLLTVIAIPYYLFALQINPYWIHQEWFIENLSSYNLLGIPLEELAWYFFTGLTFSALWEFMNGLKFVKIKRGSNM